jgi:hypothetical protein
MSAAAAQSIYRKGKPMEDWQERLKEEAAQLADRLAKLTTFLDHGSSLILTTVERGLLVKQKQIMEQYRDVLDERIKMIPFASK